MGKGTKTKTDTEKEINEKNFTGQEVEKAIKSK